jgi:hypothetical protein
MSQVSQKSLKAHQRVIRERHEKEDPRQPLPNLDGCQVEAITREEAESFILKYEWLGTMGIVTAATYGMCAPVGELIGVAVFGWPSAQSRDICGQAHREKAICLERGACSHYAPPNAASFLISRAVKLAAADHGWRIFYAYADPEAGEIGTVYQACNWLYIGQGVGRDQHRLRQDWYIPAEDKVISSRTLRTRRPKVTISAAKARGWIPVYRHPKHKYVHFEGTRTERKQLLADLRYPAQPYPKR